jgi:hypothetical protein
VHEIPIAATATKPARRVVFAFFMAATSLL